MILQIAPPEREQTISVHTHRVPVTTAAEVSGFHYNWVSLSLIFVFDAA